MLADHANVAVFINVLVSYIDNGSLIII